MNVTRYKSSVLVVDDDPGVLALLDAQLAADFEVVTVCTCEQARGVLAQRSIDILLCDLQLPDESGIILLDSTRRASPQPLASCSPAPPESKMPSMPSITLKFTGSS